MTRLKELREEKGLTARAAAFGLDIPYTTYVGYEKGTRNPKFDTLINIADYFDISLDYLLGRSDDRGGRMLSDAVASINIHGYIDKVKSINDIAINMEGANLTDLTVFMTAAAAKSIKNYTEQIFEACKTSKEEQKECEPSVLMLFQGVLADFYTDNNNKQNTAEAIMNIFNNLLGGLKNEKDKQ